MFHRGQRVRMHADSEFSTDFVRPVTERALLAAYPDYRLVLNKRCDLFQVMRIREKHEIVEWSGMRILNRYYGVSWELDWREGLEWGDDPLPLIKEMYECDNRRTPELTDLECFDKIIEQREALERKAGEEYKYAFLDNRRLLMKAYEPLYNQTAFVR